jgi:D-alanine-D-alanine ligase-like ATP-grasp enzyme
MIRRDEMKKTRVALVYNAYTDGVAESVADSGGVRYLRQMVRGMARALRKGGNEVAVISLADDLQRFQRTLQRLKPDVVFNQYDDVVHGALYEMRVAALVRIMGYPITGSPALALGLSRYKYMCASLLQGAGIPIPPDTTLFERIGDVDGPKWSFPLIVQPSQEHAGIGVCRDSVVRWSGLDDEEAGEILNKLEHRAEALGIGFPRTRRSRKLMEIAGLATALAMDYAYTGRLIG